MPRKPNPKSKQAMAATINRAFYALERIAYEIPGSQRYLLEAESASREVEKNHRGFGRRFTNGRAGYKLSVDDCARLFVVRHAFERATQKVKAPRSWRDANIRQDVILSYCFGECIREARKTQKAFPNRDFLDIDYARDIADDARWNK